jgi:glycosyltransferase involved in cell wall biosynthesis
MPNDAENPPETHDAAAMLAELARLRAANARLSALAAQASASAAAQALRSGAQGGEAHALRQQVAIIRGSLFWRATLPLRVAVDLARGAKPTASREALLVRRAFSVARHQGVGAAVARIRRHLRSRAAERPAPVLPAPAAGETAGGATMPPPNSVLAPSVLIVAELTLAQCAKYRVWQKQEHFGRLGVPCRVVDWRFAEDCLSAAALTTQAILYRVPAFPTVLHLIDVLHRLGVPTAWEVDDLIFDEALFLQNRNVAELDPELREGILSGVDLYRTAMLACGAGIASTPHLAAAMRTAGLDDVAVVENALDAETLALAARLRGARRAHDGVVIAYGSGTKTHDADFREAAPALLRLLQAYPEVRLRVIGELNLPPGFDAFGARVERLAPVPYARYLELLADSDINMAPLEPTLFNDAKSNIKFLEAAILGVPSVSSPRANFVGVIQDGGNGMLAAGEDAWYAALSALTVDAALRARLGEAARQTALDRYEPAAIARAQVAPLLARAPDARRRTDLRMLFANVYYAPRSYGGATLVVEEMARRFFARGDTDVHVVTALPREAKDRAVTRTNQDGIAVYAMPVADQDAVAEFDDPTVGDAFGQVLDAVQPEIVHLHSVQWLSAALATACRARGIPYVITVHDAWWLCARQFMVRGDGTYCFQETIDLHVCANCMPGARHLAHRKTLLKAALDGASLLLSPSEAHRKLYLANGIAPERIEVAPNGVRLPAVRPLRAKRERLRFAYVGGNVEVKGFSIVKRAFEALARGDWDLVLVDNTLNLGFSSVDAAEWRVRGELKIVPAYTQDGMDEFFSDIDVLLFPSQWKESFGLTVREALARDVWVIATDGGGPGEAISEGVNGNLVPLDGRHEPVQAAVEALLDKPSRLAGYRNPRAAEIMDFAQQAHSLRATLARVARSAAA